MPRIIVLLAFVALRFLFEWLGPIVKRSSTSSSTSRWMHALKSDLSRNKKPRRK